VITLQNAIKFTPVGGTITVSTSTVEALDDGDGNFTFLPPESPHSEVSAPIPSSSSSTTTSTTRRTPDLKAVSTNDQVLHKMPRSLSSSSSSSASSSPRSPYQRRVRAMLRIAVCDTGIGIEGHILPHLFHAFEQGDASITVRFGGLGMGLAISSSLVKLHHGTLSAASEGKNKGACFTICLPTVRHTRGPSVVSLAAVWLADQQSYTHAHAGVLAWIG
jgi:signal transduction histidine kinase